MILLLPLAFPVALAGARPITPAYEGNCQSPTWSRDGARLAYEVNFHDRKVIELYIYEPGKGDPRQVKAISKGTGAMTAGFEGAQEESVAHEVSWGPALMGRFVYSASTGSKDYDLFIDRAGPIAVAPGADGGPSWSPDGRWIAFTSARSGQGDLYLLDAYRIEEPPRRLTRDPESSELYVTWSADSSQLVYTGHSPKGDNLFIIEDLADPKPRRLTDWGGSQTRPTWSPDGKRVAFYSNHDDPKRMDLYVLSLGGTPFPLVRGVVMNQSGPSWTPDGSSLVYVADDDAHYDPIYITPVTAPEAAKRVSTGTVGNGDLDVVRGTDGRTWLALSAQGSDQDAVRDFKRIYVMELPGS